jgi:hypothetical protein
MKQNRGIRLLRGGAMSDLILNISIAVSAGALFLFMVLAMDYILAKKTKKQRDSLYSSEAKQGYQELEVSKN